jgi:uncharacterized membrane protein
MSIVKRKSKEFILTILLLQLVFYATVIFNISIARQIVGFLFFTFVPGFILIKLFKTNTFSRIEVFLLCVGLSMSFLMIGGVLINEFSLLIGILQPLSQMPLILAFSSAVLLGAFLAYLRGATIKLHVDAKSLREVSSALVFALLPFLSVIGSISSNVYGNSLILLIMIGLISLLFILTIFFNKLFPSKFYPFVIFMISISLLYHSSFISPNMVSFGSDLTGEYFAFKNTQNSAFWDSNATFTGGPKTNEGRIYSMLSVTILPTVYSSLLDIDPVWMFKIIYPLLFSLLPVGLYLLWKKYIGEKVAFISAFFFVSQETFYTEMLGLNRQIMAELFFILLLLLILNGRNRSTSKWIFFMFFSFAVVTSHYGLSEIVLFLFSVASLYMVLFHRSSRKLTISMVLFLFVVSFSWYIFINKSVIFDAILEFSDDVYRQLGDFLNPASRGETVLRGLGLERAPSIWNTISRVFAYITEAFIVVGFLELIIKRGKFKFDKEYFILTFLSMGILMALIVVPGLAETMNMTRFYHVLLFFLAPLCVLGAEKIVKLFNKRKIELVTLILLSTVLVPFFLFQTEFMFEVVGSDSWSVPLSMHRMSQSRLYWEFGYINSYSIKGAKWLSKNIKVPPTQVYADSFSRSNELRGYGLLYVSYVEILSNATQLKTDSAIYLNPTNVIDNILVGKRLLWNTSDLQFLNELNKVYSNGGSEVYEK